jgi:hypothetical protein
MRVKKLLILLALYSVFVTCITSCKTTPFGTAASSSESNLSRMLKSLKNDKSVVCYAESHDSKKIAVVENKPNAAYSDLYLFDVSSRQKIEIAISDNQSSLHTLIWSYDDKYFSVNDGTGVQVDTYIINVATNSIQLTVGNCGMVWNYNKNIIAFTVENSSVQTDEPTELGGSTDVVIYDIITLKHRKVLYANKEYLYNLVKWDEAGLTLGEHYIASGGMKNLTLKISQ